MERCPRCQTPLGQQAAQGGGDYFGPARRERTRDRGAVGDRSAARQERAGLEGELKQETKEAGQNVNRSELDQFVKGPNEHVPGGPTPPAPAAARPAAFQPAPYTNPYLQRRDPAGPAAQFTAAQPPASPPAAPGATYDWGRSGPPGGRAAQRAPLTAERMGAGSFGTLERVGLGVAGYDTAEFVMDGRMPELREADEAAYAALGIDMRRLQSTFCENPREWEEKMLGGVELSPAMRSAIVQNAREDRYVRGVFLPSRGLYINGAAFQDPMGADRPQVVSTAVHEKIGHGFCNTYTLKGEEETRAGSALFRLASTFGLKQIDEPLYPIWVQKKNVSLRSSFFLEEGFASWVQFHIIRLMQERHPGSGYENVRTHATTLEALLSSIGKAEQGLSGTPIAYRSLDEYLSRWLNNEAERLREEGTLDFQGTRLETVDLVARLARNALERLLSDGDTGPARAQNLMMALEAADRLLSDAHRTGLQLRYEGGFLMMERMKELFGERCVPAAVRIAGNVRYNLASVSVDDLTKAVSDANYNPDARLAAILRMPAGAVPRNEVRQFAAMVNRELGYSVPEGLGP